ncbi:MAG: DUF1622 domain-containing protein, partial [Dehalococcoidia bacterium]
MIHLEEMETYREWIELAGRLIESVGVIVILAGVAAAIVQFIRGVIRGEQIGGLRGQLTHQMKVRIGLSLLLGLEILVAADIVDTVILAPTLENVAALGLLVLVRTFLTWSVVLEI